MKKIFKESSITFEKGSVKDDPTKAITPMIYYTKVMTIDGAVVVFGCGWWHWYANVKFGYLY